MCARKVSSNPWLRLLSVALAASLSCSALRAQVPQLINYQGRVAVGTVNFDGNGQFKFALVNATGTTTYWSNDGTSAGGSQPAAAVTLPVSKGLYSVLLGNATLPNMTIVPATVFTNPDVHLRVWFSDGVNGFQLLTPDQRIAAVGYAMMAGTVSDGAITSAKIANGAVGAPQLAPFSVGPGQLAPGAVGSMQLAPGAVGSAQLAPGAVGFGMLAKPPQAGTVNATGLTFEFGQALFTATFPQAFAVAPVVTLSLVPGSAALEGTASVQVISASATQFTGRFDAGNSNPITVDAAGIVGEHTSMAVVNGNPAISYHDLINDELKYVRAVDGNGTVWGPPVTVDTAGFVGRYTSLAVVNGNPAISYYEYAAHDLKYVRATNAAGTAWGAPMTIDSAGVVGEYTSLAIVNGNPAISYFDNTNGNLKYVRATDASGTAWGAPVTIDSAGYVGLDISLKVINGNPAISYYDFTNSNLKYVRATDANGAAWGVPVTVDSTGSVGRSTSLAVVNGNPAISYQDNANDDLKYVRATDANGAAWGAPVTVESAGFVGEYNSLAVVNGRPAISYYASASEQNLKYVRAADFNGNTWGTPVTLDSTGSVGQFTSMLLLTSRPAICYYDVSNGNLKFIQQVNPPTDFSINWIALPP